jgi:formylglycine-generating enzyme
MASAMAQNADPISDASDYPRRVAFLVTIGDYSRARAYSSATQGSGPLRSFKTAATTDRQLMETAFKALDFEVFSYSAATEVEGIEIGLARFRAILEGMDKIVAGRDLEDGGRPKPQKCVAVFYFSGHGVYHDGKNYLVPGDANITLGSLVHGNAIEADSVGHRLRAANPDGVNILFYDACRNELPAEIRDKSAGETNHFFAEKSSCSGVFVGFSTEAGLKSFNNDNATDLRKGSFFTSALAKRLREDSGTHSLNNLYSLVMNDVVERAKGTVGFNGPVVQIPTATPGVAGIFYLAKQVNMEDEINRRAQALAAQMIQAPVLPVVDLLPPQEGRIKQEYSVPLPDGQKITLRYCPAGDFKIGSPAGEFKIGSPAGEPDRSADEAQADITFSYHFWMQETEVSQAQWKAVMGEDNNPSHFKGDQLPVESVSALQVDAFVAKLNQVAALPPGWLWSLPSEPEWEYGCRAGSPTATAFGDTLTSEQANFNGADPYPKEAATGPYLGKTSPVGFPGYPANDWGLRDMHGNIWEWTADSWDCVSEHKSETDPKPRAATGSSRVLRGGGWLDLGVNCRSADRDRNAPDYSNYFLGFRVSAVPAGAR